MKKAVFLLLLAALLFLPSTGKAEVVVIDLTFPPDLDVKYFAEGVRSWLSFRKAELGGSSQVYGLCVVGKKDSVEIYLDGEIEPRWRITRQNLTHYAYPRALVFPAVLSGHAIAEKIHKYILCLEKKRSRNNF